MRKLILACLVILSAATARGASTNNTVVDDLVARARKEADAGNNEAAVVTLQSALAREPGNVNAAVALGRQYLQMSRYREAVAVLEPVIKAAPGNYVLMNNVAWVRATATEPDVFNPAEAVRLARAALTLAPSDFHVWSTLAEALYANGAFDEALLAARKTLRFAELDPKASDGLAVYRGQVAKCEQAVRALVLVE